MKSKFEQLLESDPSKVAGWLVAFLGAVLAFLGTLTPQLDGVHGWANALPIIVGAVLPKLATAIASLKAYKPSTVQEIASDAKAEGVTEGQLVAFQKVAESRSASAVKGAQTRKAKKTPVHPSESKSDPKPRVKKRAQAKPRALLNSTARRTSKK